VIDFYRKKADVVFDKLKNDDPQTHFRLTQIFLKF